MDTHEKKRFNEMENNVAQLLRVQSENGTKLDDILVALKGNDLGERGMIKRLEIVENAVVILQSEKTKNGVYITAIKWLCGVIIVLTIGYMFNAAFNKPAAQVNNNIPTQTQNK